MPVAAHRKYKLDDVAAALQKAKGLVTLAAVELHADYKTVRRMVEESRTLQKVQADCKGQMIDFTEGKLYEAIGRGEPWAIQFYLRTQAKDRGYGESVSLRDFLHERAVALARERDLDESLAVAEADRIVAEVSRRG